MDVTYSVVIVIRVELVIQLSLSFVSIELFFVIQNVRKFENYCKDQK